MSNTSQQYFHLQQHRKPSIFPHTSLFFKSTINGGFVNVNES